MPRNPLTGVPGPLKARFGSFNSIQEYRAATPLPDNAQRIVDQAVLEVQLDRLSITSALLAAGMTYNLENPLSVSEIYGEKINQVGGAIRVMNPSARGENQLLDRTGYSVPVYITMDDFQLGIRPLLMSRRSGAPLDTAMVKQAIRRVNESIEDAVINGPGITFNGHTAYGLLNEPNVNSIAYSSNEAWTATGHDGADIYGDIMRMVDKLVEDKFYGPYTLFVPTAYYMKMFEDWKSNSDKTIYQRLTELRFNNGPLRIEAADTLGADRTILMQMTSDVADIVVGQYPTVVSWEDNAGWEFFFAAMAIMIPRIKSTFTGQSGIVKGYLT